MIHRGILEIEPFSVFSIVSVRGMMSGMLFGRQRKGFGLVPSCSVLLVQSFVLWEKFQMHRFGWEGIVNGTITTHPRYCESLQDFLGHPWWLNHDSGSWGIMSPKNGWYEFCTIPRSLVYILWHFNICPTCPKTLIPTTRPESTAITTMLLHSYTIIPNTLQDIPIAKAHTETSSLWVD